MLMTLQKVKMSEIKKRERGYQNLFLEGGKYLEKEKKKFVNSLRTERGNIEVYG